jgi:hypothetical protein
MKWKQRRRELRAANGMRAALLGVTLQTLADEFTELVDGTSPAEQALDPMVFATDEEGEERLNEIDAMIKALGEKLEALGCRAVLSVATDEFLAAERVRIAQRLYGDTAVPDDDEGGPDAVM